MSEIITRKINITFRSKKLILKRILLFYSYVFQKYSLILKGFAGFTDFFCINPQGSVIQLEGCIMMGLGYALTEEVKFTGGDIHTANFGNYQLPVFSWIPKIQTKIPDKNEAPQGGGEPGIICMGGVIANAVFDATGARLYQLPMTPERVLEAIAKAK